MPCLGEVEVAALMDYGFILEEHFRLPQDVEWAMDREGKIVIVQSRPLNVNLDAVQDPAAQDSNGIRDGLPGHPVLLQSGTTASRGKASGFAYVLNSEHNLLNIPEGSILVAKQTSPRYVALLGRVQAIITDVGSVTGHMASVAREFGVPTLAETGNATQVIPHGEEITLDATNRVVFKGRVESILERKRQVNPMKGSPAYKAAHEALRRLPCLTCSIPRATHFRPRAAKPFTT